MNAKILREKSRHYRAVLNCTVNTPLIGSDDKTYVLVYNDIHRIYTLFRLNDGQSWDMNSEELRGMSFCEPDKIEIKWSK